MVARLVTGKRIAVILLATAFVCGVMMTFGGYRLLNWRTYTVIRPLKIYEEIVAIPPEYTKDDPPIAVLKPGTKCRLVSEFMKDFYSWRIRCEGGVVGWINESEKLSPPIPWGSLW
jgi:hypothetical protein